MERVSTPPDEYIASLPEDSLTAGVIGWRLASVVAASADARTVDIHVE